MATNPGRPFAQWEEHQRDTGHALDALDALDAKARGSRLVHADTKHPPPEQT